ncbi:tripartite tricarboxylate transporter substrate binding protein [Amorphus coralli]|uniref:tripartite tricarboxylate transporter substrate binding protein n=1 Tax=Amorphus coralli TaxID=340680 RepID=UPI00037261EF|nr:tripartite tricarboxylate transporter substrate binding protein [Amorphus coralli]
MKTLTKMTCAAAFGLAAAFSGPAMAADWPDQDVTYIIPFNPGGESDVTARMQEPFFAKITGKKFMFDYIVGAGGAAGWSQINSLPADGSTIMGVNTPHIFLQPQGGNVGYETDDINVVYIYQITPFALIVPADSPIETLEDYIAKAKAQPGAITVGGTGTNSAPNVAQVAFDAAAGITTTYIPFSGTSAVSAALLGNQVQAQWGFTTVGVNQGDEVRMLAVAMDERHPLFPDVPTFKEKGIDLVDGARRGVIVPADTPEETRQQMSDVFAEINRDPEMQKMMEEAGYVLLNVPYSEMDAYLAGLSENYEHVAELLGLNQ